MSPGLLFLAYGVIVVAAMYGFVYIPNKKKHKKMQELHDSVKAGDMVVTIGGVVGKVAKKEGEYLTLIIDEEPGLEKDNSGITANDERWSTRPGVPPLWYDG